MLENLKIKNEKIYINDEHIATIWFGKLMVYDQLSKDRLQNLYVLAHKLNLKLNVENIK